MKEKVIGILEIKINPNYVNFYWKTSPDLRIHCPRPISEIKNSENEATLRENKPTKFEKEEEILVKELIGIE